MVLDNDNDCRLVCCASDCAGKPGCSRGAVMLRHHVYLSHARRYMAFNCGALGHDDCHPEGNEPRCSAEARSARTGVDAQDCRVGWLSTIASFLVDTNVGVLAVPLQQ